PDRAVVGEQLGEDRHRPVGRCSIPVTGPTEGAELRLDRRQLPPRGGRIDAGPRRPAAAGRPGIPRGPVAARRPSVTGGPVAARRPAVGNGRQVAREQRLETRDEHSGHHPLRQPAAVLAGCGGGGAAVVAGCGGGGAAVVAGRGGGGAAAVAGRGGGRAAVLLVVVVECHGRHLLGPHYRTPVRIATPG